MSVAPAAFSHQFGRRFFLCRLSLDAPPSETEKESRALQADFFRAGEVRGPGSPGGGVELSEVLRGNESKQ